MSNMIRRMMPVLVALAALSGAAGRSEAGSFLWSFSYDFPPFGGGGVEAMASGTLTTSDIANSDGSYTIQSITGTRTFNGWTDTITGLLAPGSYGSNNNELFPTPPIVDTNGFSFTISRAGNGDDSNGTATPGNTVNVYYSIGSGYTEFDSRVNYSSNFNVTLLGHTVPEPSTLVLAGIAGLVGLGCARCRRAGRAS